MKKTTRAKERLSKGTTAHYIGLENLRAAFRLKPVSMQTKDAEKLEKQQTKFLGVCMKCGQPMKYISDTNVVVCGNEACKGFVSKKKQEVDDSMKKKDETIYNPINRLLDEKGSEIAAVLFN